MEKFDVILLGSGLKEFVYALRVEADNLEQARKTVQNNTHDSILNIRKVEETNN